MLDEKHGYGIYTLPVLRWRLYIITSPSMAAAINRVPKNLSFRPIQVDLVQRVGGLPAQTDKINRVNLMDEEAEGVMTAIHEVIYSMVPSGPGLEKLTQAVINQVAQNFGGLPSGKFDTGLYEFCKHMIGTATIRALYGQDTPLDHPSLISDYWEFDEGLLALLLSPLPSITHKKPHAARERLARLLVAYFEGGHDAKACDMMRARFAQYRKHGYSTEGLARTELCFIVGAVSNTTITAFWFLARILADASIVDELRAEITAGAFDAERHRDGEGAAAATFEVAALRSPAACPLLNSVFRETLRLASTTTGSRQVLADTAVGDERYLLKRGAFVSVEGSVLHYKHAYWGPDAARFNARRFVCSSSAGTTLDGGKKSRAE
ncbi:Cytochrome P450 [Macrophomina phaseolina MS6]|uniref:Cytochrome P450 n=1 Tax=Macrophomina phaseolina (strain MS6) TaxID=1126212 RepID=K2RJD7_MACPH|nr:Cytochrome P450 [Macrophomina phaseolina MS6]